jgi:hypothetical protein
VNNNAAIDRSVVNELLEALIAFVAGYSEPANIGTRLLR